MELQEENERLIRAMMAAGNLKTEKIIEAFRKIPRHHFVTNEYLGSAYLDIALPTIGSSTISQPTTVAIMTEALQPKEGEKILEIGTGSGWQTCILAWCVGKSGKIITIDIHPELIEFAVKNIKKFDFGQIEVICGDGSLGYKKEAPYDGIICSAACPRIPEPWIEQLKVGGRIIAPVGPFSGQELICLEKRKEKIVRRSLGEFIFVPLIGKYGYKQ